VVSQVVAAFLAVVREDMDTIQDLLERMQVMTEALVGAKKRLQGIARTDIHEVWSTSGEGRAYEDRARRLQAAQGQTAGETSPILPGTEGVVGKGQEIRGLPQDFLGQSPAEKLAEAMREMGMAEPSDTTTVSSSPVKVEATEAGKTVSVPAADKPGLPPKEQKKYLLAEIDKAM